MSYWVALIGGATLGMFILSWLVSFVGYKNFEPIPRAVATVMTAYVIAVVVYGSNEGQYGEAMFIYGIAGAIVFFERKRHYQKHWTDENQSEWHETFR